jgi:1-acyl-sn-glycerol-3-phosphate acyltransferase
LGFRKISKKESMHQERAFQSIEPFTDKEIEQVLGKLVQEPHFQKVLMTVFPDKTLEENIKMLRRIKTIKEFQRDVISYYLKIIVKKTITNLSSSGIDQLDPNKRYLFISNHRDIILDSALLNVLFVDNKLETTEIAIGNNLLIYPWIEMLVKLNRSFVVKRNLPAKEMLEASKELSAYMQYTLLEKKNSIWIAQKEGRTKDGNDCTQPALLKMIHMSSELPVAEYFKSLQIVPLSISYEVEPCDKAKTAELYTRLKDGSYVKDPKEDLLSMSGGLNNYKGRVHFQFGKVLNKELDELNAINFQNDQYVRLAQIIDDKIHEGFKLFAGSFIAYDILSRKNKFKDRYTKDEFDFFVKRMNDNLKCIEGDKEKIKQIFLGIYANPLINKFKLKKIPQTQIS